MIDLIRYNDSYESVWDEFISTNKRNATFLHSRKFYRHNPDNLEGDASLLFYKKNQLISVLPARLYSQGKKSIFHSHPASTYGGFVLGEMVGVEEAMGIVEETINFARSEGASEILIRNPFRIFHQMPSDETDYAMWYYGFVIRSRELECVILIDEYATGRYEDSTKRSVKKAQKNLWVGHSEKYNEFWPVLATNLFQKHKLTPVHSLEDILRLRSLVGTEKIQLVVAEYEHRVIAGIVLFVFDTAVHAQYIAYDHSFQELRPLNAVIDFIVQWCQQSGYKYFNFGTANEDAGKTINKGLFKFKEGFGGRGVLRETMVLSLDAKP